ncbi:hypothetical protein Tco_0611689 [Tanacetum coccineum]
MRTSEERWILKSSIGEWQFDLPIYTLQLPPFELVKQALNTDEDSPAPSTAIPALDVGSPHSQMGISEKPLCRVDSLLPATKSASASMLPIKPSTISISSLKSQSLSVMPSQAILLNLYPSLLSKP